MLAEAGIGAGALDIVIHGTTLATNALIERRGARTALVTTEGFRDVIEMRTESRFEQYDLNLTLPTPLVPREDRFTVAGRIGAQGQELAPLHEAGVAAIAERIAAEDFGAVAIGFIHSYMNPGHERRAREIIAAKVGVPISISSEVSPQMREFERFNTVCANAYARFFGRAIDGLDGLEIEVVTWSVKAQDERPGPKRHEVTSGRSAANGGTRASGT